MCTTQGEVAIEHCGHAGPEGHEAVLTEFRVADSEKTAPPINVVYVETAGLAHPQAETVEHSKDGMKRGPAKLGPRGVTKTCSQVEKRSRLLGREYERGPRSPCTPCRGADRRMRNEAARHEPAEQAVKDPEKVIEAARPMPRPRREKRFDQVRRDCHDGSHIVLNQVAVKKAERPDLGLITTTEHALVLHELRNPVC